MEEDLKINKEPNITRPDLPNYVGPDEGRAEHTVGPLEIAAGLAIAPGLVMKATKAWGAGKVLDAGMQIAFPDAEDTKLEQALDFNKPIKTGIKATRLMYEKVLKEADVYSKSRFSSRLKREAGKKIIDDYLHKKVVQGPHKAWQDQNIPQTELSKDISDLSKKHDMQFSAPDIPQKQRMIFSQGGIRGGHYDHYKFKDDGWMSDDLARETLETYQTEGGQFVPGFFKRERDRLLPGFIDEYGDYLVNSGLVSRENLERMKLGHNVELHHITPLKAGAALYHDTDFGDAAWRVVTDVFHEHGLFPGMGRPSAIPEFAKTNYMMTLGEPHNLLHNKFLAEFVGKDGSKFFTPARMQLIESGLEGRKLVATEYALIIKQGQAILEDGMKQMEALFSQSGVPPEELTELLQRASSTGELKILDTDLLLRSVNDQLKNIAEEVSWEDYGTAFGDEVPEVLQRHLDKAVQSFFQRVQKEYGLGGKGGLGKPPINPYE